MELSQADWIATMMGRYLGDERRALIITDDKGSFTFYASSIRQMCRVDHAVNMKDVSRMLAGVQIVCVTIGNHKMNNLDIFRAIREETQDIPYLMFGKVPLIGMSANQQWKREMEPILHLHPANAPVYVSYGPQEVFGEVVANLVGWKWKVNEVESIA